MFISDVLVFKCKKEHYMWLYHIQDCNLFHVNHFYLAPWSIWDHWILQNMDSYNKNTHTLECFHPKVSQECSREFKHNQVDQTLYFYGVEWQVPQKAL